MCSQELYEGGYVQAGDSPFTGGRFDEPLAAGRIYEQDVPLVSLGDRVEIHIDSLPNETFIGKITFLAYAIDPVSARWRLALRLPTRTFGSSPACSPTR